MEVLLILVSSAVLLIVGYGVGLESGKKRFKNAINMGEDLYWMARRLARSKSEIDSVMDMGEKLKALKDEKV